MLQTHRSLDRQGKTEVLGEKPVPVPLCPPQIPHGLARDRTGASAVRGRRLTAWAMARPGRGYGPAERQDYGMNIWIPGLCHDCFLPNRLKFVFEQSCCHPRHVVSECDCCKSTTNKWCTHMKKFLAMQEPKFANEFIPAKQGNPCTGMDRPWWSQEIEAPRFQDNRHMKVVRFSALGTDRLYPPRRYSWYSFLVNVESTLRP